MKQDLVLLVADKDMELPCGACWRERRHCRYDLLGPSFSCIRNAIRPARAKA